MNNFNDDFLDKHKKFRIDSRKLATVFFASAFIIAIVVFWWLKLVGITVTGDAFCGLKEHIHGDSCYVTETVCGFDETSSAPPQSEKTTEEKTTSQTEPSEEPSSDGASDTETPSEVTTEEDKATTVKETTTVKAHIHTDECYKKTLSCTEAEHTHTQECFPDKTADTETVSDWLSTFDGIEITNNIPENLIAIAMTQRGYSESSQNFEYDEDGNKNGYTRYGEWYGNPYGKWNTMFVSFCLHYSNVNNGSELKKSGADALRLAWQSRNAYSPAKEYTPERGDIVFIDDDADKTVDTVGIIISPGESSLQVVMGDSNGKVETVSIDITEKIIGYGKTGELSFAKDMEHEINKEDEAAQQTTVPEETTQQAPPLMMMSASPAANNSIEEVNDLTILLKDFKIETHEGDILGNDSVVYIGQTYKISLRFAEINTGDVWYQFKHDDDHRLYYKIPENIHYEPFEGTHPITAKTENGTIEDVGEYFINEDGFLVVVFKDDENGQCFASKYSNVDFTIDFNATVGGTQSGESTEVVFNEEIKVNLNIDTEAEMKVTKTHGSYNGKDNTIDYQITIEATKAVIKNLVVPDDVYANNNHHILRDTIVVTDLDGNILDPQPTIGDGRYSGTAEAGFTLSGFPDFAAGEGYIINYKAAINDDQLSQDKVGLWNGVYPYGENATGEPVTGGDDDWISVELNKIEKGGKQAVLTAPDGSLVPVIEWEIEIKKSDTNLQGSVVVDTLGHGLEYYTGKAIQIKRYDQWGNKLGENTLNWSDVKVDGNSMSFALPDGHRFVIVYYTTYEKLQDGEQKHYTNTAKVTINEREETAGGEADVVGFIPHITKSASGDDGEYVYFTIEADVPGVIKDWGGFFLTDLAAFWGYKENDEGFLYVENAPEDLVITAVTKSGRTVTFTPYVEGGTTENTYILASPAGGNQYHSFNIYFNTSEANLTSSKWILSEDSKLTVTYKIPFDAKTGTEWTGELKGDKTVEDLLLKNYKLANEAYLNYTDLIRATGTSTYEYSPMITKKSSVNDDGTFDYTVTFYNTVPGSGGNQGYLTSAYSINLNDTFDEKLEYVEGSLTVTCYNPWDNSVWYNKYVYDGQISGNTMIVQADQLKLSQTNPALPEKTIGWIDDFTDYQKYCNQIGAGGKHVFTYKLKLKDKYLNTTEENKYTLDNTAELKWNTDNTSGPVTDTVEYKTGLLDKHVVQADNKLLFNIHVNSNALDILKGTETIVIEDTMTHNLSVYWDSIKLLYIDKQTGKKIDFDSAESRYKYTVTYDQTSNKLTFVLPDSLHIIIDYATLITESGHVSVNNAVKVDGKAKVTDIIDATFKVDDHSGGATASIHNITLLKQDGDTDERLPNVSFLLYGPMGDPNAVPPDGAEESILTDYGKRLYYIGSYTTGADGTVNIETQYLTLGGPYALVETVPPEGYMALSKPVYFYFYEPDPSGITQTVTTLISVENFTYGFVLPETGGTGTLPTAIIGLSLMAFPILYSTIRRKRERRFS